MSFLLAVHVFPKGRAEIPPSRRPLGAAARDGLPPPPGAHAGNCRLAAWAGAHPMAWEPHLPRRRRDMKVAPMVTAESVPDGLLCRTLLKLTRADEGPRRVVTSPNILRKATSRASWEPLLLRVEVIASGQTHVPLASLGARRRRRVQTQRRRGPGGRLHAHLSLRTAAQALLSGQVFTAFSSGCAGFHLGGCAAC